MLPWLPLLVSYHILSIELQLLLAQQGAISSLSPLGVTLVLRTASHRSAAWHSPCHRWTLAQELLIKEHVRTAPSCHPCESRHLGPSHTLLHTAVLIKGALGRTKRAYKTKSPPQRRTYVWNTGVCHTELVRGEKHLPNFDIWKVDGNWSKSWSKMALAGGYNHTLNCMQMVPRSWTPDSLGRHSG